MRIDLYVLLICTFIYRLLMAHAGDFLIVSLPENARRPLHLVHVGNEMQTETMLEMNVGGDCWSETLFFKGNLVVVGGASSNPYSAYEIDLVSGRRRRISDMHSPRGWSHQLVSEGDLMYAIGGHDNKDCDVCEKYNWKTNIWSYLPKMSRGRWYFPALLSPDGRVFALGGDNEKCTSVEMLDSSKSRWWNLNPMLIKRWHSAAVWFKEHIIVAGGTYDSSTINGDTAEMFSPPAVNSYLEKGQWTIIAPLTRVMRTNTILILSNRALMAFGVEGEFEILENSSKSDSSVSLRDVNVWKWKNAGKLREWNVYNVNAMKILNDY